MTPSERHLSFSIASIYAFRMLGLFMVLPVFSLYLHRLSGATPVLMGLALGIYGLTQAILQLPFGMASDRMGRKPVIIFGLLLFMLGSIIAAVSHGIYGIILGRALQGAGAVGSTLMALVADSTADKDRLKAMSIIGMTIGFSFVLAMILGPLFDGLVGLSGIFWFTAILAGLGIVILLYCVPTPKTHALQPEAEPVLALFKKTLFTPELLRLNLGIFCLHASLMALFMVIPLTLVTTMNLGEKQQWLFYLPILIVACIAMVPFMIIAETKNRIKAVFISAILVLTLTEFLLGLLSHHPVSLIILVCLFFTAFTLLEGILPSLVSKIAAPGSKGTAMGIYSSSQFLGIFFGGFVGGLVFHHWGPNRIFLFCSILGLLWLIIALPMKNRRKNFTRPQFSS